MSPAPRARPRHRAPPLQSAAGAELRRRGLHQSHSRAVVVRLPYGPSLGLPVITAGFALTL